MSFSSAGIEHQNVEVVCAAINTFGSSQSSLILAVQAENPKISEESKEEKIDLVATRDAGYLENSRQPAAGMEKLVGDKENIQLSEEEEIFWIPFHQPKSNQKSSNQAEEEKLVDNLTTGIKAEGGTFKKAEQADKVKAMYQEENLAGHEEKKTQTFEENLTKKETFDIKFARLNSAHAPFSSLCLFVKSFVFMQSVLYFYFGTFLS